MRTKFTQHMVDYAASGLVITGLLIAALALAAAPSLVQLAINAPAAHVADANP